jgi:hypothetical protein
VVKTPISLFSVFVISAIFLSRRSPAKADVVNNSVPRMSPFGLIPGFHPCHP